jgi:hypothetical protein
MVEPGLDLHDWETRWEQLQEEAAAAPDEALPEIVLLVEQMLVDRGYELNEPVTRKGEDYDILMDFLAAREVARAVQAAEADPEDVETALENLREIHDYLVEDRAPP